MDVTKEARPLPLEYLIIELTTSSPRNPLPMLPGGKGPAFPVENRAAVGQPVQVSGSVSDIIIGIDIPLPLGFPYLICLSG